MEIQNNIMKAIMTDERIFNIKESDTSSTNYNYINKKYYNISNNLIALNLNKLQGIYACDILEQLYIVIDIPSNNIPYENNLIESIIDNIRFEINERIILNISGCFINEYVRLTSENYPNKLLYNNLSDDEKLKLSKNGFKIYIPIISNICLVYTYLNNMMLYIRLNNDIYNIDLFVKNKILNHNVRESIHDTYFNNILFCNKSNSYGCDESDTIIIKNTNEKHNIKIKYYDKEIETNVDNITNDIPNCELTKMDNIIFIKFDKPFNFVYTDYIYNTLSYKKMTISHGLYILI